ncbi:MAG TPA: hypothetical protein VMZ92_15060 [Planctomycetota bacterium]|nr:hypothetical protein [Planctomycetota bacterium]
MRRLIATTTALAVVLGAALWAAAEETVTLRGIVLEVHPWRTHDDGPLLLVVILKGEGPWRARLTARPADEKAYATVGALTRGDKVAAVCTGEDESYWIKEITKEGHVELPPRPHEDPREREERMRREQEERMRRERGEDRPREPDDRPVPHDD